MSESKSSSVSLDLYSTKSLTCKSVFPHRLVRPLKKGSVNNRDQLSALLADINSTESEIWHYIADNLKRANAKEALNHAARFGCEYCFSCGVSLELRKKETEEAKKILETERNIILEKIKTLQEAPSTSSSDNTQMTMLNNILKKIDEKIKETRIKKSHIVWPFSTNGGEPRTHAKVKEIAEKVERGELTREEAKGIIGRSPLFDLDRFDIVMDVPTEYLHSTCLGVVKRLVELTFSIGEKRPTVRKVKLVPPQNFNKIMLTIKVFHEFSRRARELDFSVMKGQEFRNLILFFFPIVVKCIENDKEKKV